MHGSEVRSLLHPFLLLLILERPDHGYDLVERLAELGVPDVEPGHVYRVLRGMERDELLVSGWVTSDAGPARRRYQLTAKGREDLTAWTDRLTRLDSVIEAFLARGSAACTAPCRSAADGHGDQQAATGR